MRPCRGVSEWESQVEPVADLRTTCRARQDGALQPSPADRPDDDKRGVVIVSHDARLREVADRVLWLEDEVFREVASLAVDPVCGMSVERTGLHVERGERTLWFYSNGCRSESLADPQRCLTG